MKREWTRPHSYGAFRWMVEFDGRDVRLAESNEHSRFPTEDKEMNWPKAAILPLFGDLVDELRKERDK